MWNRTCPLCFTRVSGWQVAERSAELECEACHKGLEIARPSRWLSVLAGIAAAFAVGLLVTPIHSVLQWLLAVMTAVMVYGCVSAAVIFQFSDLVVRKGVQSGSFPHFRE